MEHNRNDNDEMWDWKGEDYGLQLDESNSLWNNVSESGDDLSYVFNETTPVKSCGDLAYQVTDNASSQAKRRRMLHFEDEVLDVDVLPLCDEDFSSTFLKNLSGTSDIQINLTDSNNLQPENGGNMVPERHTPTRQNVIFKGKKSFIKTPTRMTSSVVLPFAFVKPCGVQGAVTLKDINQKILTPPPSKSKKTYEDPTISYPTSAFSGKPIVGKTKIRTEGGKGSITIMRTKG
ncbi:hypothetical protein Ccrd_017891 [Cynara cardunculus var. scolymus]|uniref:Protein XRI1 n=1 Tax=Cynara cardunculus var. scolymus TaxID=59895 RepID=A0A103Y792_CYNCS|nr:hypothetical protein Ccrd_017891 [Cynara cardunculus var. scolymus]